MLKTKGGQLIRLSIDSKNKQMDPKDNKRSLFKLKSSAEYLKSILSTMERAHCSIDALYDGIDFDYHITRQRFEGACQKTYEPCLTIIDDLLDKKQLSVNDIDKVRLSTHFPCST
jgi:L1 cell adhesion molecule like protein